MALLGTVCFVTSLTRLNTTFLHLCSMSVANSSQVPILQLWDFRKVARSYCQPWAHMLWQHIYHEFTLLKYIKDQNRLLYKYIHFDIRKLSEFWLPDDIVCIKGHYRNVVEHYTHISLHSQLEYKWNIVGYQVHFCWTVHSYLIQESPSYSLYLPLHILH